MTLIFPDLKDWTEDQAQSNLGQPYFYERKYDGTAAIIDIFPDKDPVIWGRGILASGKRQVYTQNFPEIVQALRGIPGRARLVGELVGFDDGGNDKFKIIQQRAIRKKDIQRYSEELPVSFMAFDITRHAGTNLIEEDYLTRRAHLNAILSPRQVARFHGRLQVVPTFSSVEEKVALLDSLEKQKFEGVVIKHAYSKFGENMFKYKPTVTEDVIWFGEYKEGTGRNEGKAGSLICYQYLDGELEEVAKVGGMSDEIREYFTSLSHTGRVNRKAPMVLEIKAMSYLPSGKLRSPRYVRMRHDKTAEQCTRELV